MEIVQVILSSILSALSIVMSIGCTISAGEIEWYHPFIYMMTAGMITILSMSVKEYKNYKQSK
jgi:formate hydrogenlyase subunit 3/multisubunit Na+/H+ antiporter MnhD subunit